MEHSKDGEFSIALVAQMSQAAAMSNEQAEKLTDSLKQALKTQTSYKIKNIKSKKDNHYLVTYEIYGVDFIGSVGKALKVSFEKITNDSAYADNEGQGVRSEILKLADESVYIPIYGQAESLNVGVAAGIMMYGLIRKK